MVLCEQPSQSPVAIHRPRLEVTAGPLACPIVARFMTALTNQAGLPVDRLEDASRIGQAIATACAASGSRAHLSVQVDEGEVIVRCGPLAGGASALLEADRDEIVRGLASSIDIRYGHSGEYLLVAVRAA